jgi:copper(I)-binding protein
VISSRALSVTVSAAAVLSMSACGLETKDYTEKERAVNEAANFQAGSIDIRDAYLTYPVGSATSPYLAVTFINEGSSTDTLRSVSIPNAVVDFATSPLGSGKQAAPPTDLSLPPGVVVNAVDPSTNATGTALAVTPNGTPPAVGTSLPVTFTFDSSGTTQSVQVPVMPPGATTQPTQLIPTDQTPMPSASGERAVD